MAPVSSRFSAIPVLQVYPVAMVKSIPVLNRLLTGLPRRERVEFQHRCELVDLTFGSRLCEQDQLFQHIFFPLTAFISLVTAVNSHQPLEMGLIGSEGMLGATLVLGVNTAPLDAMVSGAGTALRMRTTQLRKELSQSPALLKILNRYVYVLITQLAQSAACTHFHEVESRLARWLLMTHDRAHGDHFHLTHQYLADMLGVRRSGITVAAGALQQRGLIHYTRGEIEILDRAGLELASCECYEAAVQDYARVLP